MKTAPWRLALSFSTLGLLAACGDSGSTSSSTTSTGATTSTTGGGGAGGTSSTTGTGGTGGNPDLVNGCDPKTATDRTADATVNVDFGGALGLTYDPPCIKIKAGSSVKFVGTFAVHPLLGGTVTGATATPDAASPIKETTSGMEATFVLPAAGTFPYYCGEHFSTGMTGAVFVE